MQIVPKWEFLTLFKETLTKKLTEKNKYTGAKLSGVILRRNAYTELLGIYSNYEIPEVRNLEMTKSPVNL